MKRVSVLLVAILALTAIGGVVTSQAAKKKVKTKLTLSYAPPAEGDYYAEGAFSGKAKAKKGKCKKRRTVTVKRVGGAAVGTTKTKKNGKYALSGTAAPGQYVAKAKKKTITKKKKNGGKKKIVCKKAKSNKVTVS